LAYPPGSTTTRLLLPGAEQDSVDALSFETLIPKNIIERYVSLLVEHRRLILCGPTGTGKTYLASRLAQHFVRRSVSLRGCTLYHDQRIKQSWIRVQVMYFRERVRVLISGALK